MRIYQNFMEALPEIKRDLAEMGIKCHPQTYQDKYIGDNPEYQTLELQNYIYTVIHPHPEDLESTQPWADEEFEERLSGMGGNPRNPGHAWKLRREVWEEFLELKTGKFAYTYSERLALFDQVSQVIARIVDDPDSRQLFISIWNQEDATKLGGLSRVPCSIGYQLQCRKHQLNLTYLQRSADFVTHFVNDIYLAVKLQELIAKELECKGITIPVGTFTHWIGSLHIFKKNAQGVF